MDEIASGQSVSDRSQGGISGDMAQETFARLLARIAKGGNAGNRDWIMRARTRENILGARSCDTRTQLRNLRNLRREPATRSRGTCPYIRRICRAETGRYTNSSEKIWNI